MRFFNFLRKKALTVGTILTIMASSSISANAQESNKKLDEIFNPLVLGEQYQDFGEEIYVVIDKNQAPEGVTVEKIKKIALESEVGKRYCKSLNDAQNDTNAKYVVRIDKNNNKGEVIDCETGKVIAKLL